MPNESTIKIKLEELINGNDNIELVFNYQKNQDTFYFLAPRNISTMNELNGLYYKITRGLDLEPEYASPFHGYNYGRFCPAFAKYTDNDKNFFVNMGPNIDLVKRDLQLWKETRPEYNPKLSWDYTFIDVFKTPELISLARAYFTRPKNDVHIISANADKKVIMLYHSTWPEMKYVSRKISYDDFVNQILGMNFLTAKRFNDFETKHGNDYYSFDTESDIAAAAKFAMNCVYIPSENTVQIFENDAKKLISKLILHTPVSEINISNLLRKGFIEEGQTATISGLKLLDLYDRYTESDSRTFFKLHIKKYDSWLDPTTNMIFATGRYKNNPNIEFVIRAINSGGSTYMSELRTNNLALLLTDHTHKSIVERIFCVDHCDLKNGVPSQIHHEMPLLNYRYGSKIYLDNDKKKTFKKKVYNLRLKNITVQILKELNE